MKDLPENYITTHKDQKPTKYSLESEQSSIFKLLDFEPLSSKINKQESQLKASVCNNSQSSVQMLQQSTQIIKPSIDNTNHKIEGKTTQKNTQEEVKLEAEQSKGQSYHKCFINVHAKDEHAINISENKAKKYIKQLKEPINLDSLTTITIDKIKEPHFCFYFQKVCNKLSNDTLGSIISKVNSNTD